MGHSKQRLRLWIRMLRATRYVEGELRERLRREIGTTMPRFDVLAALYRADQPMTKIAPAKHAPTMTIGSGFSVNKGSATISSK